MDIASIERRMGKDEGVSELSQCNQQARDMKEHLPLDTSW
jgi:hypothetical protein